ncbi:MAG: hypothetical protein FD170_3823 [Bacteroidetes bacterium]|nr:MAG: hypothetical protein FD170_3823 [Bacteroidota bacterium]
MKIIVTGSLGNISKPLAEKLLAEKHEVTIISSKADKKPLIEAMGAKAAIGSVDDVDFLTATFKDADAVYTMVPPFFGASDWKKHIARIGENMATAVKTAGVKYVVNLSSVGAHMPEGCGPVSGLYFTEKALNALDGVHVKHLRPGFFYTNFYANIGMVKHMGIIGSNYGAETTMMLADPGDIAAVAVEELTNLTFTGKSIRYIASDERTAGEIAKTLGNAIGKPDLNWVEFGDADSLAAMQQNGLPEEVAKNYVEMGTALRSGEMAKEYNASKPVPLQRTKLETFAQKFAGAYSKA